MLHKRVDPFDQVLDANEGAAANGPLGDQAKPTLHLIQPGRVRRRIVNVIARPLCQPGAHLAMLVRGVIVHDEVNVELFRDTGVEATERGEKLLVSVAGLAFGEDRAGGDVKRGVTTAK